MGRCIGGVPTAGCGIPGRLGEPLEGSHRRICRRRLLRSLNATVPPGCVAPPRSSATTASAIDERHLIVAHLEEVVHMRREHVAWAVLRRLEELSAL